MPTFESDSSPLGKGTFVSPGVPKVLYHYTSPSGLRGIVERKSLHCSSAQHLSDAEEISFAVNETRPFLREITEELQQGEHQFAGEIDLLRRLVESLEKIETEQVYVGSFSVKGNLLSQWRAYCPNRGGYSVGFDAEKLAALSKTNGFNLVKCVYSRDDYWPELEELVMNTLQTYRDARRDETQYYPSAEDMATSLVDFFEAGLAELAARVKHPAFREEQEWRLVASPLATSLLPVEFRQGPSSIVPFIDFALEVASDIQLEEGDYTRQELRLPISKIFVGPTPHPDLAQLSAERLCASEDVYPEVESSGIPYRTW